MDTFLATKINSGAIFTDKGKRQTVTYLKAEPLTVKLVKTMAKDGYEALVCALGEKLQEIRLKETSALKSGEQIKVADVFAPGDWIKVSGSSKGRGFAGVIKRHGFHGVGGRTHGQSDRQRHPGSSGMRTTPGRLWKGKRMAGHYGNDTIAIKNLQIIKVEDSLLTISGTVPGSRNALIKLHKI